MKKFFVTLVQTVPTWGWVTAVYLATHLPGLTALPVFADEAIYIRWSQLILDDAARYAFFSMADGKPPLFFWIQAAVLPLFDDPLFAGRLISVVFGLLTVYVIGAIVRLLTPHRSAVIVSMLATSLLPFWFFHQRMALIDTLNAFWIATAVLIGLSIAFSALRAKRTPYQLISRILLFGLVIAAALMTKLSVFLLPVVLVIPIISWVREAEDGTWHRNHRTLVITYSCILAGIALGIGVFALLRVSPLFGALFSRSQDFTFTLREIFTGELDYILLESMPRVVSWLVSYLTLPFVILSLLGLIRTKRALTILVLLLCAALYAAPLIGFGRVLWPRYFLPVAVFVTLASSVAVGELMQRRLGRRVVLLALGLSTIASIIFLLPSWSAPERIPFVQADQTQYLTEWSAGYGNAEVVNFIQLRRAMSSRINEPNILVLTEGSFGTLPDGILMYFHGRNQIPGVEIQGVGVSIATLPADYVARARTEEVYYVVNSHRFAIADRSNLELQFEVKRPYDGPSLLVYRVRAQ